MEVETGPLGPLLLSRSKVDRAAARRNDAEWLAKAWADPATRVLVVEQGRTLIRQRGEAAELAFCSPAEAPEGERYLLGQDADGTVYFAVAGPLPDPAGDTRLSRPVDDLAEVADRADVAAIGLRQAGGLLGDRDAGLLVNAVALEAWHDTHQHCPRCGSRTRVVSGGHVRLCPEDGSEHFPRVDPAVIMLVHDDRDRALLARGPQWPERRVSVLAGFVEPGESLEQAVVREVAEEVGLPVTDPRYLGSQPWPFPRSLMLGFFARATATDLALDPAEIAEARWFTRAELKAAVENGELLLPGRISIARRLIETWYGGPLPGTW